MLPFNEPEFVFELAHELAHVKMDAHFDNYLVETFAVAVSIKTLKYLRRFDQQRKDDISNYINSLPQDVQSAIGHQRWTEAATYWQSEIPHQKSGPSGKWNFSFAMLGSLILEAAQQPAWPNLLGVAAISDHCILSDAVAAKAAASAEFKVCSPALRRMGKLRPALRALGYATQ